MNSDVVVLGINRFQKLGFSELWIGFRSGETYANITIHNISQMMGLQQRKHSRCFTGCRVVSAMFGIDKRLHEMHRLPFLGTSTPSSPSSKTENASYLIHFMYDVISAGRYSYTVRTVMRTRWMKQWSVSFVLEAVILQKPRDTKT